MNFGAPSVIITMTLLIVLGAIIISLLVRRRSAERDALEQKRMDLMNSLLQKFDNSKDLVEFIKTEEGRRMIEGSRNAPVNTTTRTILLVALAVLSLLFGGGMTLGGMVGFFVIAQFPPSQMIPSWIFIAEGVVGVILLALGIYFFWLSKILKRA